MTDRILSMVGLAKKAGRIADGEFMTETAVRSGKAFLVIISEEASGNTLKKFRNMCAFHKVPCYRYGSSDALGHSAGKAFRMSVAVTEEGFAKSIEKRLKEAEIKAEVAE